MTTAALFDILWMMPAKRQLGDYRIRRAHHQ
jgi:hypothetical protein